MSRCTFWDFATISSLPRRKIKHDRGKQGDVSKTQRPPQHGRTGKHQYDEERKHIHVGGLELEDQALVQDLGRPIEEYLNIERGGTFGLARSLAVYHQLRTYRCSALATRGTKLGSRPQVLQGTEGNVEML